MPPSTPGRLPPLPIVDTPTASAASEQAVTESPSKVPTATMLLNELELQISSTSPSKVTMENISVDEIATISSDIEQQEIPAPVSSNKTTPNSDSNNVDTKSQIIEQAVPNTHSSEMDEAIQKNVDILEAVCESYQSMPLEKRENKELSNSDVSNLLRKYLYYC